MYEKLRKYIVATFCYMAFDELGYGIKFFFYDAAISTVR